MRTTILLLALLVPAAASARPLMDPTPTPAPSATPVPAETPGAGATPAPAATDIPSAAPTPSPEPAWTPEPPPAPIDYTAGMPGSAVYSRRFRGALALGFHVFTGEGWDKTASAPASDPPRGADFVGGSLMAAGIYDLSPIVAFVGTGGGHQGTHTKDTGVGTTSTTVALNAWYVDGAMRLQTPANVLGIWVQAGAGLYVARKQIETKSPGVKSKITADGRAGLTGHLSTGLQYHLAQGLDVFGEVRWMTAPGAFHSDPALDLGGFTTSVGASLRL